MKFAIAFNQQYVVPSNIRWLIANLVDFYAAVPAKFIDSYIKRFFLILESESWALGC